MKKGPKKTDTMKFSTDHRADLLTEALVRLFLPFKVDTHGVIFIYVSTFMMKTEFFN